MNWKIAAAGAALAVAVNAPAFAGPTLDSVKQKGFVQCGVNTGLAGFGAPNDKGEWSGLDVDICRAVAAAMFGDATKVKYAPPPPRSASPRCSRAKSTCSSRNTTWTLSRDTDLGFDFVGVNYYDGQGFMVRKSLGVKSAKELDGAAVCVQTGTTTELNLADYFRSNNMELQAGRLREVGRGARRLRRRPLRRLHDRRLGPRRGAFGAEESGRPHHPAGDHLQGAARAGGAPRRQRVGRHRPLDPQRHARRRGVRRHLGERRRDQGGKPAIRRSSACSASRATSASRSARPDWAYQIIKQVGNYGESFERNVGPKTPLGLSRGLNACGARAACVRAADPLEHPAGPRRARRLPGHGVARRLGREKRWLVIREAAQRPSATPFWNDQRIRGMLFQVLVLGALLLFAAFIVYNTAQNLQRRGMASGFDFLWNTAGFDISVSLIPYKADGHLRPGAPRRHPQHPARLGDRHRLATMLGFARRRRPAVDELADRAAGDGLRRDDPQHPAAAADLLLVLRGARRRCRRSQQHALPSVRSRSTSAALRAHAGPRAGLLVGLRRAGGGDRGVLPGRPLGAAAPGARPASPSRCSRVDSRSSSGCRPRRRCWLGVPSTCDPPVLNRFNFKGGIGAAARARGAAASRSRSTPRPSSPRSCAPASRRSATARPRRPTRWA